MNLAVELNGKGAERVSGKTLWTERSGGRITERVGGKSEGVVGCCNTVFGTMSTFVDSVDRLIEGEDRW